MPKIDYAARARAFVGTRFRPQGRGPDGFDCVGLALAVYAISSESVRRDYRLRGCFEREADAFLRTRFRQVREAVASSGDLLMMRVAHDQLHFAVRTAEGFVHAHAGLRFVVETPGMPEWPVIGIYRKRRR